MIVGHSYYRCFQINGTRLTAMPNLFQNSVLQSARSERFKDHLVTNVTAAVEDERDNRLNSLKRFKGVSQDLEKPYLRLTSAPKAAAVRPLKILR